HVTVLVIFCRLSHTPTTYIYTLSLHDALPIYELLPLWHALFTHLGFRVEVSGLSSRRIYEKGQFSIPSDTACYPAKIMHGHMERSEEHTSELQSRFDLVCRLLLEKKKK